MVINSSTAKGRVLKFHTGALDPGTLHVTSMEGEEAISRPYRFHLEFVSRTKDIDSAAVLETSPQSEAGKNVWFRYAQWPALLVRLQASQLVDPADCAVGTGNAVDHLVSAAGLGQALAGLDQFAVLGVHALVEGRHAGAEVLRVLAEDGEDDIGPVCLAAVQVDFPVAQVGDPLGFVEALQQRLARLGLALALEGGADPAGE